MEETYLKETTSNMVTGLSVVKICFILNSLHVPAAVCNNLFFEKLCVISILTLTEYNEENIAARRSKF